MKAFCQAIALVIIIISAEVPAAEPLHVLVVNAAGVEQDMMDAVVKYAEKEMEIPVRAKTSATPEMTASLFDMGKQIGSSRSAGAACLIALVRARSAEKKHAFIMTNEHVVVVNVTALQSEDKLKFTRRLQRWVLRGTAFLLGIGPDVDPHCVMIDYNTMDELDRLGMNFSPPWGVMVQKAAVKRGFEIRPAE